MASKDSNQERIKEKKSFKFKGFLMFYNGSGHTNPHLEGVGFAVFRKEREICGGFETISFGFNNIGEFTGCLRGIQNVKSMIKEIMIVEDCIILTKIMFKTHTRKNYTLNELLCEITS